MPDQIILTAIFQSVRSTVDGGLRISFDLDSSQADMLSEIMRLKDKSLFVVVSEKKDNDSLDFPDLTLP